MDFKQKVSANLLMMLLLLLLLLMLELLSLLSLLLLFTAIVCLKQDVIPFVFLTCTFTYAQYFTDYLDVSTDNTLISGSLSKTLLCILVLVSCGWPHVIENR